MHTHGGHRDELSRRDLIRRAAVAGTLAWTAPIVLGSLTDAAFAATPSGCTPYYVKLIPAVNGACYDQVPGSGGGFNCPANGTTYQSSVSFPLESNVRCARGVGGGTCTAACDGPNENGQPNYTRPIVTVGDAGSYWSVTLPAGYEFNGQLTWTLGGRYDTSSSLSDSRYTKVCSGGASGIGGYGTTVGYVAKSVNFGSTHGGTKAIQYIYAQFCGF